MHEVSKWSTNRDFIVWRPMDFGGAGSGHHAADTAGEAHAADQQSEHWYQTELIPREAIEAQLSRERAVIAKATRRNGPEPMATYRYLLCFGPND